MMGSLTEDSLKGIIPRLCDTMFDRIVEVSGRKETAIVSSKPLHYRDNCSETVKHAAVVVYREGRGGTSG